MKNPDKKRRLAKDKNFIKFRKINKEIKVKSDYFDDRHIGLQIKKRRESLKIPQSFFADHLGISKIELLNIERGNLSVDIETLLKIEKKLDFKVEFFKR